MSSGTQGECCRVSPQNLDRDVDAQVADFKKQSHDQGILRCLCPSLGVPDASSKDQLQIRSTGAGGTGLGNAGGGTGKSWPLHNYPVPPPARRPSPSLSRTLSLPFAVCGHSGPSRRCDADDVEGTRSTTVCSTRSATRLRLNTNRHMSTSELFARNSGGMAGPQSCQRGWPTRLFATEKDALKHVLAWTHERWNRHNESDQCGMPTDDVIDNFFRHRRLQNFSAATRQEKFARSGCKALFARSTGQPSLAP